LSTSESENAIGQKLDALRGATQSHTAAIQDLFTAVQRQTRVLESIVNETGGLKAVMYDQISVWVSPASPDLTCSCPPRNPLPVPCSFLNSALSPVARALTQHLYSGQPTLIPRHRRDRVHRYARRLKTYQPETPTKPPRQPRQPSDLTMSRGGGVVVHKPSVKSCRGEVIDLTRFREKEPVVHPPSVVSRGQTRTRSQALPATPIRKIERLKVAQGH